MKFGQYIKQRREALKLTQSDIPGFNQSYIADIENGRLFPRKEVTIKKLASGLQMDTSKKGIDFLQVYSLLDHNPYDLFGRAGVPSARGGAAPVPLMNEDSSSYHAGDASELRVGMAASVVIALLGQPDNSIKFGAKEKWIYEETGVHILFEGGKVVDVAFK
jgi:transcriptional regulator with XRE-family HTH domain